MARDLNCEHEVVTTGPFRVTCKKCGKSFKDIWADVIKEQFCKGLRAAGAICIVGYDQLESYKEGLPEKDVADISSCQMGWLGAANRINLALEKAEKGLTDDTGGGSQDATCEGHQRGDQDGNTKT